MKASNYELSGNYSFYVQPRIIGNFPYSNSVISINVFKNENSKIPLPIRVKWIRNKENRSFLVGDARSNTY